MKKNKDEEYAITNKGITFYAYLKDMKNGETYRRQDFEDDIAGFMNKQNKTREEVIDMLLAFLNNFMNR